MAIGCGAKISKFILITFNILFWLSGLILIVVSTIYLFSGGFRHLDEVMEPNSKALQRLLYIILILGFIVFIIGFCGCCGAIRESRLLLGIYIGLLLVIMLAEIACGIYAIVKKNKAINRLEESMKKNINEFYRNETQYNDFRNGFDFFQKEYKCCGVYGSDDWKETSWYKSKNFDYMETPVSCCKNPNVEELRDCYNTENYYKEGCSEKIKSTVSKNFPVLIGILIGIAVFEILVVVFACCLCQNTGYVAHSAI